MLTSYQDLYKVVKTLAEALWEDRVSDRTIQLWLGNFTDDAERWLALHLLAHFSYFGQREVKQMLRALYRELVRYPMVQRVRAACSNTTDSAIIEPRVLEQLLQSRFLGMGNPSESGTHLLYYFRQVNDLPKELFINSHRIFRRSAGLGSPLALREPDVRRYIFLDDLCGSGTQAQQYSEEIIAELRSLDSTAEVSYLCLFGLARGLDDVRKNTAFTEVRALFSLDDSFRCFHPLSRYYLDSEADERAEAESVMRSHGDRLLPGHALGYKDGQLLLGFFHNVPDNALPVLWAETDDWRPIFPRYSKLELW